MIKDKETNMEKPSMKEAAEIVQEALLLIKSESYDKAIRLLRKALALYEQLDEDAEVAVLRKKLAELYLRNNIPKNEILNHEKLSLNSSSISNDRMKLQENKVDNLEKIYEKSTKESNEIPNQNEVINENNTYIESSKVIDNKYTREFEDKSLQDKIIKMVDEAEKLTREYEVERNQVLKNGSLNKECVYPQVIKIYEEIISLLLEHGWDKQAAIYRSQVNICEEKLSQDMKIREIEALKAQKNKEFEDSLKNNKEKTIDEEKVKKIEEQYLKEAEDKRFQNSIAEKVAEAEKMAREYEIKRKKAIKHQKIHELEPSYSKVIEIYNEIREKLIERDWISQLEPYLQQIKIYENKLEQDKKLRKLEEEKKQKENEYLENLKLRKLDPIDINKLKAVEEKHARDIEDKNFELQITSLIEEADKLEREYESEKKKAIKEKRLLDLGTPYPKIIQIYEELKKMVQSKGWTNQISTYESQIKFYREKYERDEILRQIEAHKLNK
ncbi:MAG: hypothetical protein EU542_05215 [Promethearchaeota archaeon]|nr:MAG: hypothetical protein EU542_05215 [Candidatus Lokiarchaeota archaeon]